MEQHQPSESQSKSYTALKLVEEENWTGPLIQTELGKTGFKNMSKLSWPVVGENIPALEDLNACQQMWEAVWH